MWNTKSNYTFNYFRGEPRAERYWGDSSHSWSWRRWGVDWSARLRHIHHHWAPPPTITRSTTSGGAGTTNADAARWQWPGKWAAFKKLRFLCKSKNKHTRFFYAFNSQPLLGIRILKLDKEAFSSIYRQNSEDQNSKRMQNLFNYYLHHSSFVSTMHLVVNLFGVRK